MTTIKTATLPRDERGNDPNDFRDDPEFVAKLAGKEKPRLGWIEGFKLTKEEAEELSNPEWIYENLIIQGHLIVIPAPPNGGKTTILMHIAGELAADYEVCYVNADVGSGDVKIMQAQADEKGFHLLLPDMKAGQSMDNVVGMITAMNEKDADYRNIIFFFDTLKKMTDVINKSKAKQLYKILRGLTAKGMTIILLAHTNKYNDGDGKPIYEGTGDTRSDVDELIYLISKKDEDGSMTVSTDPDKVRGVFEPITFYISPDREVTRTNSFIDVASDIAAIRERERDSTIIEAITEVLQDGECKQVQIVDHCHEYHKIGRKPVERVLKHYCDPPNKLWNRRRAFEKNAWLYRLET